MKHNVFDNDQQKKTEVLSHADQASIISMAKSNSVGSLRTAMDIYVEQNPDSVLAHGISVALYNTGFGLIIAIPGMIFWRHFRALVNGLVLEMQQQAVRLVEVLHGERKA